MKTGIRGNVTRTTDKTNFYCLIVGPKHLETNGAIIEKSIE